MLRSPEWSVVSQSYAWIVSNDHKSTHDIDYRETTNFLEQATAHPIGTAHEKSFLTRSYVYPERDCRGKAYDILHG